MWTRRLRGVSGIVVAAVLAACGSGTSEPGGSNLTPSAVSIVSGNGQVGLVGQTLSVPLVVKVLSGGDAVVGATVAFAVTSGSATVNPATAVSDSAGQAKTQVTLGASPGAVAITATVSGTTLQTDFLVTAGSSTATLACSGSATTPAVGDVLPGVSGTGICLGGASTGAEYAVVAFYANPDATATTTFTVTGAGATAVSTPSITPGLAVSAAGVSGIERRSTRTPAAFDAQLRETSRRELRPLFTAARERAAARHAASFNAIPANPTVGTTVTLNANGLQACTQVKTKTARVAAVSNNAIIVADTENPTGGFTDAEYLAFATTFDTLVNPLDVATFGAPTDIDKNGKVVIFFTKEVNALTEKGSTGGTIGGFFFERDLFPTTTTGGLSGCAGSNFAEMFYTLVPDPQGVFSNAHTKQDILETTPSTLAHEYQHLINAGRRLYVNNADDFEEVWLNEGLSHIAEELLYYRVVKLGPRQNIGISQIRVSQAAVDAFNDYQGDNNGRYEEYIGKPTQTSPYADNDDLATRGATWNLLRYLADHRGSSDGDVWSRLVNSRLLGQANVENVFGITYLTQFRDWATSVISDDVPGVTDAKYLQPSWNMRSIFPALVDNAGHPLGRFPLSVFPLSGSTPADVPLVSGGAAYLRFSVSPGSQASIDWSSGGLPVSPLVQFSVVRTK